MGQKEKILSGLALLAGLATVEAYRRNKPQIDEQVRQQILNATRMTIGYEQEVAKGTISYVQARLRGGRRVTDFLGELLSEPGSEWIKIYDRFLPPSTQGIFLVETRIADQTYLSGLWIERYEVYREGSRLTQLGARSTQQQSYLVGERASIIPLRFHPGNLNL